MKGLRDELMMGLRNGLMKRLRNTALCRRLRRYRVAIGISALTFS